MPAPDYLPDDRPLVDDQLRLRVIRSVDSRGEHRFIIADLDNHEPLAVASEGYRERRDRDHAIERLVPNARPVA